MLGLSNISKDYTVTKDLTVHALKEVTLNFRDCEFVSVLGPSGCGKTTLLNVVGGLDRYDSGDLIINGKSTADFTDSDWDTYRSRSVGFVFQSYNLVPAMNVLDNVALALSVAGVSRSERLARAKVALERVGLGKELKKYPNQLSGGQMQRVAIARAISGNPDVILADEPTGALDSETGTQIMELLKEISRDRLVVVVTHNRELAEQYSTRIVSMSDGRIVGDTDPFELPEIPQNNTDSDTAPVKKSKMSLITAFRISLRNLKNKLGRTLLTSFAGSVGIFGIALVLAISIGMGNYVDYMQTEAVGDSAVTIGETAYSVSRILSVMEDAGGFNQKEYPDIDGVIPYQRQSFSTTTTLSDKFIEYINNINPSWIKALTFSYSLNMHVLQKVRSNGQDVYRQLTSWGSNAYQMVDGDQLIESNYNVLYKDPSSESGYPRDITEVSLVVDKFNRISPGVLSAIGIGYSRDSEGNYEKVLFEDIVGQEYEIILNDGWYSKKATGNTFGELAKDVSGNYYSDKLIGGISSENKLKVRIVSVLRAKNNNSTLWLNSGLAYLPELSEFLVENAKQSEVGKAQAESTDVNVLTGGKFSPPAYGTDEEKADNVLSQQISALKKLGAFATPTSVRIYPKDLDSKQLISNYIDSWNRSNPDNEVSYLDITGLALALLSQFIDVVTYVLIAFSAVALLVSTVMISVITYTSVIERIRVIGVLRSIGARKVDVANLFNSETLLIGTFAGIMGVVLALVAGVVGNLVVKKILGAATAIIEFTWWIIVGMLCLSIILTLLAGLVPAVIAAKKEPVACLRSE